MASTNILAKMTVEIGAKNAEFARQMAQSQKQLGSFAKSAQGIGRDLQAAFATFSAGLLVREVIEITSSFQKFEAVLTNTLGSNSAAQKALSDIKDFAARTPFSVQELTSSFVKLANQGFKPSTDEMRKLGDLASSTGKGFDQLAEAIIDAQTGEFERLKEFGIRASKHGDQVTFSFKGIQTQTKFTSEAIREYILSLGDAQGVSGAMAAISETLGGKISNLGDAWDNLLLQIGKGNSGIFSGVIDSLTKMTNALSKMYEVANSDPVMERFAEQTAQAVEEFKKMNKELQAQAINQVVSDIQHYQKGLDELNKFQKIYNENLDKGKVAAINMAAAQTGMEFSSIGEGIGFTERLARMTEDQQKAVKSLVDQYKQFMQIFGDAGKEQEVQLGLLESLNKKLKELEDAKLKAFDPASVAVFNDQIKSLREEIDLLNASTTQTSKFFKQSLSNAEQGKESKFTDFSQGDAGNPFKVGQIPGFSHKDLENSPLIKERDEIKMTMDQWIEYYSVLRGLREEEAQGRLRAAEAAATYGEAIGDALGDAISGQQSFNQSMKRLTADLVKMFLQRALAGIISSAASSGGPPPVAIALAAAGVAAISAMFSKIGAPGGGGGSAAGLGRQASTASRVAQNQQSGTQLILGGEFRIKNGDLVLALAAANVRSQRTG